MVVVVFGSTLRALGRNAFETCCFPILHLLQHSLNFCLRCGLTLTLSRGLSVAVIFGMSMGCGLFKMSQKSFALY